MKDKEEGGRTRRREEGQEGERTGEGVVFSHTMTTVQRENSIT